MGLCTTPSVGHVSCSEMWSCLFDFSSVPVLLLTFITSVFPKQLNIGTVSGFPPAFLFGNTRQLKEPRTVARASEITLRYSVSLGWNVEVSSSSASFLESGLCFVLRLLSPPVLVVSSIVWPILRARSYRVVWCFEHFCGWTGHTIVYLPGTFILAIWKRVVPIHSSERTTYLSSFQ